MLAGVARNGAADQGPRAGSKDTAAERMAASAAIRRCRNHKLRNAIEELPKDQQAQAAHLMRAAWNPRTAEEGEKRLEQLARFLVSNCESAARSLREGLAAMFTLQRLNIPPSPRKCPAPANIIESPQAGVQKKTANLTRWRDQDMAGRWAASAWLLAGTRFRRLTAAIPRRETGQHPQGQNGWRKINEARRSNLQLNAGHRRAT
ncbi:MAG: hypothetical protein C0504_12485 [Candidatus Solibacter sp.]|nr:hypothetical protein [Candidatus Solibacter sp.]